MKVRLTAEGQTALVVHNERLADPLDTCTQAVAAISKKRNKTLADHEEVARREFLGGLYTSPSVELDDKGALTGNGQLPVIPAWNVLRCLQDGATRQKRGKDILRGVQPLTQDAALIYDGPTNPLELWKAGTFTLRKTVGVQRARTVRTRPMFTSWTVVLDVEVDALVIDVHTLKVAWADAGRYSGLAEMRPVYGRFEGTLEVIEGEDA